jgi:hypothetical protein
MIGKVIQGSFLGGHPKWSPVVQPKIAPSSFHAKTMAPPPTAYAGRLPGAPPPVSPARRPGPSLVAVATHPPKPPTPPHAAQPSAVQRHGAGGAFAVEAGQLGLASSGGRSLPDAVRGKMEAALGADFSGVRGMSGRRPSASARSPSPSVPTSISRRAAISPRRSRDSSCSATSWRTSCSSVPAACATRSALGSRWCKTARSKPRPTALGNALPHIGLRRKRSSRRRLGRNGRSLRANAPAASSRRSGQARPT